MFCASLLYTPGSSSRTIVLNSVLQVYALVNSTSARLGALRGVVFIYVMREGQNPIIAALSFHSLSISVGITIDILPFALSSSLAFLKKLQLLSVSLCRAIVRDCSSHLRLFTKYGGLHIIVSKRSLVVY